MRDALWTPRTCRYAIAGILTGKTVRTAADAAAVATLVARGALAAVDGTAFGLFDSPIGDDSVSITNGAAVLTSPNNPWTAADVGKAIDVQGAGAAGATLRTAIAGYTNPGSVTLATAASTTVAASSTSAGGLAIWGNTLNLVRNLPARANEGGTLESSAATTLQVTAANAKAFGAKGDGVTDDTAAINLALASGAGVFLPRGTYKITSGLLIDVKTQSLSGDGAIIDATAVAGVAITLYSSAVYAAGERVLNNHNKDALFGVSLKGSLAVGTVAIQIGRVGAGYVNSNDIVISRVGVYQFETQLLCVDNGWRAHFIDCGFEAAGLYPLYSNNPTNAGEIMHFSHCWFVDFADAGKLYVNNGQWLFDGCSFFGGSKGKFHFDNNAIAVFTACNLESQPGTGFTMLQIDLSARVALFGCILLINPGANFAQPPIKVTNTGAHLHMEGCRLALYGAYLQFETGSASGLRALIDGIGQHVTLVGNNTLSGTTGTYDIQAVVGGTNHIYNGDAETNNTNGWTVGAYGTGGSTFVAAAAAKKNGTYGFRATGVANGGVDNKQIINVSGMAGRLFCFGLWTRAVAGTGSVSFPQVVFKAADGTVISTPVSFAVTGANVTWMWRAGTDYIPQGAVTAEVHVDAQQLAGGCTVDFDDIIFQVI